MDEITIVRKRSRLWPIVLAILLIALIALAAMWLWGSQPATNTSWNEVNDLVRRSISGTT